MFTNLVSQDENLYKILSNPMPGLVRAVFFKQAVKERARLV